MVGVNISKDKADEYFEESKIYYTNEKYTLSILFSIFCLEESSKIIHLMHAFNDKQDISSEEWKDLTTHDYKLIQTEKEVIEYTKERSEVDLQMDVMHLKAAGLEFTAETKEEHIQVKTLQKEVQQKFEKVKQVCLYADWNKHKNNWFDFNSIPKQGQKHLALFIHFTAEEKYLLASLTLEYYHNPFPKMSEIPLSRMDLLANYLERKIKHSQNLETTKKMKDFETRGKHDQIELQKGFDVLRKYFSN